MPNYDIQFRFTVAGFGQRIQIISVTAPTMEEAIEMARAQLLLNIAVVLAREMP